MKLCNSHAKIAQVQKSKKYRVGKEKMVENFTIYKCFINSKINHIITTFHNSEIAMNNECIYREQSIFIIKD